MIETGSLTTADGRKLVYQSVGSGPPIVLSNGLGGTFDAWRHLWTRLVGRYRVLSWYYRGLHGSSPPADPRRVHVRDHTDDLQLLLDHWGVGRAPFIGWSMGVQVNLELYRRDPRRMVALAALNGLPGQLFETVPGARLNRRPIPAMLRVSRHHGPVLDAVARRLTIWPGFIGAGQRVGFFARGMDEALFAAVLADYGRLDFGLYAETLRQLGLHDAWDMLPSITVPTKIIAGERDPMTPALAAARMARAIPGARLIVVPGATHFAAVERPEEIAAAVGGLLARAGY